MNTEHKTTLTIDAGEGYERKKGQGMLVHGLCLSKVYNSWKCMKQRCLNPNNNNFRLYGGRGILIAKSWKDSFANFFADMGHPPTSRHSLDRINPDGNYEKENCRWATQKEQNENHRVKRLYTFNGETKMLSLWKADPRLACHPETLPSRLKHGVPFHLAFTSPTNTRFKQRDGRADAGAGGGK